MTQRLVTLREVCSQDRTSVRPGHADELAYLGLEGIESGTGQILDGELSKTPEVPQANSFRFDERHVLYGKLRPYLNKVAVPTVPGKCSTEIIPLLPLAQLDRKYLSYFLRVPATVKKVAERSSGARMPRADMDFVLSLPISLPAIEEQRRIVDLLARAEGIVINRVNSPEYLGKSAIIPALPEPTVFESNMMRFAVDRRRVLPEFIIALLQQPASRRHLMANAKHAINQSSINQRDVKSLPVMVAPKSLQQAFAHRIQIADSIRSQQAMSLAKAQATFDALLSQSFHCGAPMTL